MVESDTKPQLGVLTELGCQRRGVEGKELAVFLIEEGPELVCVLIQLISVAVLQIGVEAVVVLCVLEGEVHIHRVLVGLGIKARGF